MFCGNRDIIVQSVDARRAAIFLFQIAMFFQNRTESLESTLRSVYLHAWPQEKNRNPNHQLRKDRSSSSQIYGPNARFDQTLPIAIGGPKNLKRDHELIVYRIWR
jgi:hypothetical protein